MNKNFGIIGLIFVTIIWGGGFVATDIGLSSFTTFQTLTIRFFLGFIALGLLSLKDIKRTNKEELKAGLYMGVALFLAFVFQTAGLVYTTASKNAFLTGTNVVIVPFIAYIILKKKVSRNGMVGAIIAILGIAMLSLDDNLSMNIGDILTLVGAVFFALQIFLTSQFVSKYNASILNTMQMLAAFILSIIFTIFRNELIIDVNVISRASYISVIYLGVGSTAICYMLQTNCQKYVDETRSAIILSMESLFGVILSVIILGEGLTVKMVLGCGLILFAVILSNLDDVKESTVLDINNVEVG